MKHEIIEYPGFPDPIKSIIRTDGDGTVWSIPEDEANVDYQAYLTWLAEQSTPKKGK